MLSFCEFCLYFYFLSLDETCYSIILILILKICKKLNNNNNDKMLIFLFGTHF